MLVKAQWSLCRSKEEKEERSDGLSGRGDVREVSDDENVLDSRDVVSL